MANHTQTTTTRDNDVKRPGVVVVVVPFIAQGHLNQLLHFSRLISAYDLPVHFISTATHCRQAKLRVQGWDPISISNIHFHHFPTPPFHSPPPDPNAPTKFPSHLLPSFKSSAKLREPFTELLAELSSTRRRIIVVYDYLMGYVVQDATSFPDTEAYIFNACSSFCTFSMTWQSRGLATTSLDEETRLLLERVPSAEGVMTTEVLEFISSQAFTNDKFNSGAIHDTSKVIEGKFVDIIANEGILGTRNHWALGPFNPLLDLRKEDGSRRRHKVLEWLDEQEQGSVIYVSFGSTTSFSDEEIEELAIGIERSGQKFVWVLREADRGDIFESEGSGVARRVRLPEGYEERAKGLVVREWAPQLEILAHRSTGGFMSHCGWNSSMESISMGVPVAAWPMHSDQPRNAFLITEILRTGILVRDWALRGERVTSARIEEVIKRLMGTKEGEEVRKRAAEIGAAVRGSVGEGGVTRDELDSFVAHITRPHSFA